MFFIVLTVFTLLSYFRFFILKSLLIKTIFIIRCFPFKKVTLEHTRIRRAWMILNGLEISPILATNPDTLPLTVKVKNVYLEKSFFKAQSFDVWKSFVTPLQRKWTDNAAFSECAWHFRLTKYLYSFYELRIA